MKRIMSRRTGNRILLIMIIVLVLFSITAEAAEAKAMDSIKNAWNSSKKFAKSPAYWVNALIVFGALFLLQIAFLRDKIGSDTTQKVIMYTVLILLALIIATKIVASNGVPQYIWKLGSFAQFIRFLLGSGADGTYTKTIGGQTVVRQGILRTNNNGAGLPALIVSFLILYLLFNVYKSNLGLDGAGGKWLHISLSGVLAALIANQGTPKNTLIVIGGWLGVIILGGKLSKSFGGENDQKGAKKGFAFGLAFAFIQLIANILGTSLFGGEYAAADITIGLILRNILIGLAIGWIYSSMSGEGIFGRWRKAVGEKKKKEVNDLIEEGSYTKAFLRETPIIGTILKRWLSPKKKAEENTKKDEEISKRLEELYGMYEREVRRENVPTAQREANIARIMNAILRLQEQINHEIQTDETSSKVEEIEKATGIEPPPARPEGTPPAAPSV